jgi:hypothetical protein
MFIKKIDKSNPKKGKVYFTYRLCESYRIDNKVRHRSILNLGKLEDVPPEYHKLLCDRIEQKLKGVNLLFANIPDAVEKNAEYYYRRISEKTCLIDLQQQRRTKKKNIYRIFKALI